MTFAILVAVLCLSYANGANDNFKGVATLFGSGTASYRRALTWATFATLLGSLTAVLLASELLENFSGKGLVADDLAANVAYSAAVALGAGLTVLFATSIGMPVSTTHSLVGALVGAGLAAGSTVSFSKLGAGFFAPLLFSPLLAVAGTVAVYPFFRWCRQRLGVTAESCLCVGGDIVEVVPSISDAMALQRASQLTLEIGSAVTCRNRYQGRLLGIEAAPALDRLHFLTAGVVSFARGLNDTPKIAALLLVAPQLGGIGSTALVGLAIAIGGVVSARRVAETMSERITPMNHGQGFTANLITGIIVIGASRFGLPVSTTHVSCGSLFGIGTMTGQAQWRTVARIFFAWVTTLPVGAVLGAICFAILSSL